MPLASPETTPPLAHAMSPEEFRAFAQRRYGARGWAQRLADDLCIDVTQVWRFQAGKRRITERVAAQIEALKKIDQAEKFVRSATKLQKAIGAK